MASYDPGLTGRVADSGSPEQPLSLTSSVELSLAPVAIGVAMRRARYHVLPRRPYRVLPLLSDPQRVTNPRRPFDVL